MFHLFIFPSKAHCGSTPLHMAVRENCTEVVQILLENKADVNHMNPHGGTPLFEAVDKGYFHVRVTLNYLKQNGELLGACKFF